MMRSPVSGGCSWPKSMRFQRRSPGCTSEGLMTFWKEHAMTVAQLDSLVTLLRSGPVADSPDISQARTRFEKLADFLGGAPDAKCEKVDAGGVPAEWVAAPGFDPERAVLYLHGGGYAIGSINTHRRLA